MGPIYKHFSGTLHSHGSKNNDKALYQPERGDGADAVRRQGEYPGTQRRRTPVQQLQERQHHEHEQQLSHLDADVEQEQRGGDGVFRQARLAQGAGKTKSMQQAATIT